ncbi:hypothetical protein ABH924_000234 [Arthrobacter sp. GAS37]|uniref:hypothetical protein n=1 Tax=Arthrobacter sp. GAS37 TaxID=3156261 RepID=UPI0038390E11
MDKLRACGITAPAASAKRMIQQNPTVSIELDLLMDLPGHRDPEATFQHQAVRRRNVLNTV